MAETEPPVLIPEHEYLTLEQTLSESDRGRRFLTEYLRRHRSSETNSILDAIARLEKMMRRERSVPDLNRIRLDIADMHEAIERTKREISNIKKEDEESNRFTDASHELDAIITQTEGATQDILNAAEKIQEYAWTLRENGADESVCDDIDAKATEIFMACSFQDLTGQRTQKVVHVLRYLESRINLMIGIWGIEDVNADDTAGPVDSRPDAHLLNGPQLAGKGVSQSFVDDVMGGEAEDQSSGFFSVEFGNEPAAPAPAPAAKAAAAPAAKPAAKAAPAPAKIEEDQHVDQLDAATIDAIFEQTDEAFAGEAGFDDPEQEMGEDDIAKLFDMGGGDETPAEETQADAEWEAAEEFSEDEDPLAMLTESERQALFS
ncbi:chemotaxis protein [Pannonibacter phragmitetus]|uniref:Chemotaxis protein n=1 Tax=Pannonibacter phragmitetus TaxID=121719 RepID=A0A0L0IW60_9HYPH|nr:protein phosphatase CheZ [Pannonibacter phragmitetus]ALV28181.1 chemotaxis protein [Pannonibacter phragmitetus]KND17538.1 chemotaxis protein [Pannonibacter phragmitetus]MBA4203987.1 protein phosphatase CheZ [Polymorphum sp.]